jgi:phosphoserine phosphatase
VHPIAIVFDYDKTLSPHHMQEDALFAPFGIDGERFWKECDALGTYDRELAWMYHLLDYPPIRALTRDQLVALGRRLTFYPGVPEIFDEVKGAEFYIVTSGLREILEGSALAPRMRRIFGCEYDFGPDGRIWRPRRAIGHTMKTQMLFRINKGLLDLQQDVNVHMDDDSRPVPFHRMCYVGDGMTDVPCFAVLSKYRGRTIAVYGREEDRAKCRELLDAGRVDHVVPADYRRGSELRSLLEEFVRSRA